MSGHYLSRAAVADIASILTWTQETFGERICLRYEALLTQAIMDVSNDPERAGSSPRPDISPNVFTYHLFHSRNRVSINVGRIRNPRHFLLYRLVGSGAVEIGRVLHDAMDVDRQLPANYRPDESK